MLGNTERYQEIAASTDVPKFAESQEDEQAKAIVYLFFDEMKKYTTSDQATRWHCFICEQQPGTRSNRTFETDSLRWVHRVGFIVLDPIRIVSTAILPSDRIRR